MADEEACAVRSWTLGMAYILEVGAQYNLWIYSCRNFTAHVVNITERLFQAHQNTIRRKRLMTFSRRF